MRKTTLIGLGAAGLALIATFLPIASGLSYNFWNTEDQNWDNIRMVLLCFIAGIALFSFLSNKKHLFAIGNLFSSLLVLGLMILMFTAYKEKNLEAGTGIYLLLVSSIVGLVSSVLGFMKK